MHCPPRGFPLHLAEVAHPGVPQLGIYIISLPPLSLLQCLALDIVRSAFCRAPQHGVGLLGSQLTIDASCPVPAVRSGTPSRTRPRRRPSASARRRRASARPSSWSAARSAASQLPPCRRRGRPCTHTFSRRAPDRNAFSGRAHECCLPQEAWVPAPACIVCGACQRGCA